MLSALRISCCCLFVFVFFFIQRLPALYFSVHFFVFFSTYSALLHVAQFEAIEEQRFIPIFVVSIPGCNVRHLQDSLNRNALVFIFVGLPRKWWKDIVLKIDRKAEITAIKQLNELTLQTKAQREGKNWFNYSANEDVKLGAVGSKPFQSNFNITLRNADVLEDFFRNHDGHKQFTS